MVQFRRKMWHLCIRCFCAFVFHLQGPHKEFAVYSLSLYQSGQICILLALCVDFWEISLFSMQNTAFPYFAKGIFQNFAYFPTKFALFHVKCYFALYSVCILSCYYIECKFMPFECVLSKLIILLAFSL